MKRCYFEIMIFIQKTYPAKNKLYDRYHVATSINDIFSKFGQLNLLCPANI